MTSANLEALDSNGKHHSRLLSKAVKQQKF